MLSWPRTTRCARESSTLNRPRRAGPSTETGIASLALNILLYKFVKVYSWPNFCGATVSKDTAGNARPIGNPTTQALSSYEWARITNEYRDRFPSAASGAGGNGNAHVTLPLLVRPRPGVLPAHLLRVACWKPSLPRPSHVGLPAIYKKGVGTPPPAGRIWGWEKPPDQPTQASGLDPSQRASVLSASNVRTRCEAPRLVVRKAFRAPAVRLPAMHVGLAWLSPAARWAAVRPGVAHVWPALAAAVRDALGARLRGNVP